MAFVQNRTVRVSELLSGTFAELSESRKEVGIYLLAFLIAGMVIDLSGPLGSILSLPIFIGYFVAQYYLYRAILSRGGVSPDEKFKIFSFFFMAIILGFPIYFGLSLLLVPGLLLGGKWLMAPSFLVAEKTTLFEAIGASWHASSQNLLPLSVAFMLIGGMWFAAIAVFGGAFSAIFGSLPFSGLSSALVSLGVHTLPLMLMGLSITAYKALREPDASLAAVFE